ncbi:hypothetical protein POSPLADRAFT_1100048, partial [Postia placenta MAD-698-R-SB12]
VNSDVSSHQVQRSLTPDQACADSGSDRRQPPSPTTAAPAICYVDVGAVMHAPTRRVKTHTHTQMLLIVPHGLPGLGHDERLWRAETMQECFMSRNGPWG